MQLTWNQYSVMKMINKIHNFLDDPSPHSSVAKIFVVEVRLFVGGTHLTYFRPVLSFYTLYNYKEVLWSTKSKQRPAMEWRKRVCMKKSQLFADVLKNRCSEKFCNIHRKTPVLELFFKVGPSRPKNVFVYLLQWKLLKMMKNAFYFMLRYFKDIFFVLTFLDM